MTGAIARETVMDADAINDRSWFEEHPNRAYRIRRGDGGAWWIIQKRPGGVFLRVLTGTTDADADTDAALSLLWHQAAFPDSSAEQARRMARRAS